MKRASQGGSSPATKHSFLSESDTDISSEEFNFPLQSQSSPSDCQFGNNLLTHSQSSSMLSNSQNPPTSLLTLSQSSSLLSHSQNPPTPLLNPLLTKRTSDSEDSHSDSCASEIEKQDYVSISELGMQTFNLNPIHLSMRIILSG